MTSNDAFTSSHEHSTSELPPLVVIVGPTASGKTALGVELAERLNGEIISADSVQIYRYFDVGSGKPSSEEKARAPHHLIDVVEPDETMEASLFADLARQKIDEVRARGRVPLVCGGTFLWVRALLYGLADAPPGNAEIRARHAERAEKEGRAALHAELAIVDPESAARLHPQDLIRVSRALEVFELSGRKLSDIQAEHGFRSSRYRAILLGRDSERSEYDARVARRVRGMLDAGFVEEVQALVARGFGASRAMGSVGYKQVKDALDAERAGDTEALLDEIVRVTRIFARRQRTWLREENVDWLDDARWDDRAALRAFVDGVRARLDAS